MDSGKCFVKPEYLINDIVKPKEKIEDVAELNDNVEIPAKRQKPNKVGEKKTRGQNKKRPGPYKENNENKLCRARINGDPDEPCKYEKCIFIHDIDKYLLQKPKDISSSCYIYSIKGFCMYGLSCRFARSHLDENNRNIKIKENINEEITTFNQINHELQFALRRKTYNFNKSKEIVDNIQKNVNISKNGNVKCEKKSDQTISESKDNVEKRQGCTSDTDLIKERPVERKRIDFVNKLLLSPLTTVGNLPFRRICKEYGADVTCGEMACAVPLINGFAQEWALSKRHISEDIFGVQLCGNKASILAYATQVLAENSEIDFVDLNIGCPIDLIYQQGSGSALIRRQNVLEAIVRSCSQLLGEKPFTVKTRTGVYANKSVAHDLVPRLEEWGAGMVTIHGRSREQRYTNNANWQYIEQCAQAAKKIPVTGNGDILSYDDYLEAKKIAPHISGVMIGRGALIKPWLFKEIKDQKSYDPSANERFDMMKKYVNYGLEHWGSDTKGVENTRRFLLEWQSFLHRYVPFGLLEYPPQKINQRPDAYRGRDDLETLLASNNCADWIKLSEMLLGPVPDGFQFLPKHRANSYQ